MRLILKQDFHEGISWSWTGHIDIRWPANCKTISMQWGTSGHGSNNWDKSCLPGMKKEREKNPMKVTLWNETQLPALKPPCSGYLEFFFFALKKTSEICNPIHLSALKVALLQEPFFTKWTKLTKYNLKLQWLLWGTLDLSRLVFPWTKLEDWLCQ